MPALQLKTDDGKQLVTAWWAEACARVGQAGGSAWADGAAVPWVMPLDVYLTDGASRQRSVLADASTISATAIVFRSRQRLSTYTTVVLCAPGTLDGVRARITDKQQTVGGYRYTAEFQFDAVKKAASRIVAA